MPGEEQVLLLVMYVCMYVLGALHTRNIVIISNRLIERNIKRVLSFDSF
jgi:hypothetical protein